MNFSEFKNVYRLFTIPRSVSIKPIAYIGISAGAFYSFRAVEQFQWSIIVMPLVIQSVYLEVDFRQIFHRKG